MLIPSLCFGAASRDFDGVGDYVKITRVQSANTTVCAWVKFDDAGDINQILSQDQSSDAPLKRNFQFRTAITTPAVVYIAFVSDTAYTATGATTLNSGTWYYLCGSYDGETISVYQTSLNSPITTTDATNTTPSGNQDQDSPAGVGIGCRLYNNAASCLGGEEMDGRISNVMHHSRVLSLMEMNEQMVKPGTITNSLIAYYPLFGDSTEKDLSPNQNSGSVTNSTTSTDGPPVMFGGGLPL